MLAGRTYPLAALRFGGAAEAVDRGAGLAVRVLALCAIVVAGWLLAGWLRRTAYRLSRQIGAAQLAGRSRWGARLGHPRAGDVAARLLSAVALLATVYAAASVFGRNPVTEMFRATAAWLPRVLAGGLLVAVAVLVAGVASDLVGAALRGLPHGRAAARVTRVALVGLGVVGAVARLGVPAGVATPVLIALLATAAGVVVVGVGGGLVGPMSLRWERALERLAVAFEATPGPGHAGSARAGSAHAEEGRAVEEPAEGGRAVGGPADSGRSRPPAPADDPEATVVLPTWAFDDEQPVAADPVTGRGESGSEEPSGAAAGGVPGRATRGAGAAGGAPVAAVTVGAAGAFPTVVPQWLVCDGPEAGTGPVVEVGAGTVERAAGGGEALATSDPFEPAARWGGPGRSPGRMVSGVVRAGLPAAW